MKISKVDEFSIRFDNGNFITFFHEQDCCEHNYADFSQLEELAFDTEFEEDLMFEEVPSSGFRFGNEGKMFFIPCYSDQNGYYSDDIYIFYNGKKVIYMQCEERDNFWI